MKVPVWIKPGVWGAIWGAIGIMILGFWQFGWVTGGTAKQMADARAETAVTQALTPICTASFGKQADAAGKLAELKKLSSWDQRSFIEKGGWANLPGSDKPDKDLATACAAKLSEVGKT